MASVHHQAPPFNIRSADSAGIDVDAISGAEHSHVDTNEGGRPLRSP